MAGGGVVLGPGGAHLGRGDEGRVVGAAPTAYALRSRLHGLHPRVSNIAKVFKIRIGYLQAALLKEFHTLQSLFVFKVIGSFQGTSYITELPYIVKLFICKHNVKLIGKRCKKI